LDIARFLCCIRRQALLPPYPFSAGFLPPMQTHTCLCLRFLPFTLPFLYARYRTPLPASCARFLLSSAYRMEQLLPAPRRHLPHHRSCCVRRARRAPLPRYAVLRLLPLIRLPYLLYTCWVIWTASGTQRSPARNLIRYGFCNSSPGLYIRPHIRLLPRWFACRRLLYLNAPGY